MKERPILFNGDMVRAILDGRKTQTRRMMKPQPEPTPDDYTGPAGHWWSSDDVQLMIHVEQELQNQHGGWDGFAESICPFGRTGDRLWVQEDWCVHPLCIPEEKMVYAYKADMTDPQQAELWDGVWRSPRLMPREASRITLEITGVRVERLQEISEADAEAEGIERFMDGHKTPGPIGNAYTSFVWGESAKLCFRKLWGYICGPGPWDANPWVWVIEFKRVEVQEAAACR